MLYLSFELSWGSWELFFTAGAAQPPTLDCQVAPRARAWIETIGVLVVSC
jgi:hypothetical protein